ncbi:1-acyl-sn-glycerol-3-phosphate acyltransferase [Candidatus Roizmanbacteria bacterium]|nr:MAG: 1-acyl-sn-glycerol-3-phosphate acyltransferase [Candidatus Roizmanbacteria bacterium]
MRELEEVPLHLKGLGEFVDHSIRLERYGDDCQTVFLDQLRSGSVIVPFNHRSIIDPLVVMREMRRMGGSSITKLVLPATMKFFDGRMGGTAAKLMHYVAKKYNAELLPIIQHYDTEYSDEEKFANHRGVIETILGALGEQGSVVALSPEGTRSPTAQLLPAQKGIDLFMKKSPDSLVIPISLEGTEKIVGHEYKTVNPFHKAAITFGFPMSAGEINDFSRNAQIPSRDFVMLQIAAQLPQRDRGYYGPSHFPWFYDFLEMP